METRYAANPNDVRNYSTEQLRSEFVDGPLMGEDKVHLLYSHYDRFIHGTAVPVSGSLQLENQDALKAGYFLERRELGILNLGAPGKVEVDGEVYAMAHFDMLYVGKGSRKVVFSSNSGSDPARYYLNSSPAHKTYPTSKMSQSDANRVELGQQSNANKRVLYQYIHENGIQSCQLVMGFTELLEGNIWNTFPPHTHARRMEVYFYFDIPEDQIVVHFMGEPMHTRSLMLHNNTAVISPPWSIHAGAGTANYKFVWGMAGENKAFSDMDGVALHDLR